MVVSCTTVGNSEQISSIRYSINGGTTRTGEGFLNFPYIYTALEDIFLFYDIIQLPLCHGSGLMVMTFVMN